MISLWFLKVTFHLDRIIYFSFFLFFNFTFRFMNGQLPRGICHCPGFIRFGATCPKAVKFFMVISLNHHKLLNEVPYYCPSKTSSGGQLFIRHTSTLILCQTSPQVIKYTSINSTLSEQEKKSRNVCTRRLVCG